MKKVSGIRFKMTEDRCQKTDDPALPEGFAAASRGQGKNRLKAQGVRRTVKDVVDLIFGPPICLMLLIRRSRLKLATHAARPAP